jgi:hypothetical protein
VIIDECGQALEPESLASFAGILKEDGRLVVAGDPF